jgi:hypothetical protein
MVKQGMSPGQKAVEDRFETIQNNPVDQEKTPVELFGEMESWIFTLGEYRLFLNPVTRRWYYFDQAHNDWKDMNAPAGSVIFSLKGSDLEMTETGTGIPEPGPAGTVGGKERHFCSRCGAPLKPKLKFCSACGSKIG